MAALLSETFCFGTLWQFIWLDACVVMWKSIKEQISYTSNTFAPFVILLFWIADHICVGSWWMRIIRKWHLCVCHFPLFTLRLIGVIWSVSNRLVIHPIIWMSYMEGYSLLLYPLVRKLGLKSHSRVSHAVCFKPRCQYVIRLYKYVVSAGSNLVTW